MHPLLVIASKITIKKGQSLSKRKRKRAQKNRALREKKRSAEKVISEKASASSSFASKPTGEGNDQYDVFLSFRGSDTRKGFTDHLYRSLVNVGCVPISVFRDDNSLEIGEDFNSEILAAIARSKIWIPIISENYAASKWCLRDLVHIMDCKKSMSRMVLPIFYKVLPSDVRHQKGNFGKAFDLHKNRFDKEDIKEGKRALAEVSYLNGWESENVANGHEGELVEKVVKTILSKWRHNFQLDVPKHLVGVDDHLNKIRTWVGTPASHARIIGIYGMGGIGKTTLAKVIYNELSNEFVHRSFLSDIRETAHRNGIPQLQKQLIKDILQIEQDVCKVDDGINFIKFKFQGKKVLILLDDIDGQDQLYALARERDWFATGSLIIVTTRNKAVLDQAEFEVGYKYELNELNKEQSSLLFNRHAFRMGHCLKDFEGISHDILSSMGGLPLAIKVIGSYLYGKANVKVWQNVLDKLRDRPHRDVQQTLKISYDALEYEHQQIFLDIACFFIGKDSKYAIYMWEDCKFYPYEGIEELKMRCLIKIEDWGCFSMHDQLRDLGRSFFCQGQPSERCLKLWDDQKASHQKLHNEWQRSTYDYWPRGCSSTYTSELFKSLPSARFLSLCWTTLSGDFNELFSELRWLRWSYIEPNKFSSAINLHLSKLVVLELSEHKLMEDWGGWHSIMEAKQLKVLNLSRGRDSRCTPDLSAFTNLEILILFGCRKLKQFHPSIWKLKSLISLDLSLCHNLNELPKEVGELQELKKLLLDASGITKIPISIHSLRKLERLSVKYCHSLVEIPLSFGNFSSLKELDLNYCKSLRELPSSLGSLFSLKELDLGYCKLLTKIPDSIGNLSSLEKLELSHCESLRELPSSLGSLSSLKELDLGDCKSLTEIPDSIGNLSSLEILVLSRCESLREIPSSLGSLSSLKELDLGDCKSLTEIPNSIGNISSLKILELGGCQSLREIPSSLGSLSSIKELDLGNCKSLIEIPDLIGNLSSLEKLELSCCESLTKISSSLRILSSLKNLQLICCELLREMPSSLGSLSSLKELELGGCQSLTEIPSSIGNLSSLELLELSDCESLREIPSSLGSLSSLKKLDLRYCGSLREIPSSLGSLFLSKSLAHLGVFFSQRT
ncbi:hypothetical protein BT93_B1771 [Corymbia citriodora subsp. variegata]|nr:hypothetical protein BT93_B1771 [Corymbia citriodora subsp. variegata]